MERICVFIPVYFRGPTVRKSAESILQTYKSPGYKVKLVFVDNRSDDELRAYLISLKSNPDVHVVLLGKNEGKAQAITKAAAKFPGFDWFVSCDSDILHLTPGWPGILADCYKQINRAGMVSVTYVENGNSPMPRQPETMEVRVGEKTYTFRYGGQVAGGCFITQKEVWEDIGYRAGGVYGGIDGLFRQAVAESLLRKCGHIKGVLVEHLDDRDDNKDYHAWKLAVQDRIRQFSPKAAPSKLGNEKGFWDK